MRQLNRVIHFGNPHSGLRTVCGKLLDPRDLTVVLTRDPLDDRITCGRCMRTTDYRNAQVYAKAGKYPPPRWDVATGRMHG